MQNKNKTIQVRVLDEIWNALEKEAESYNYTLSLLVRNILTAYVTNKPIHLHTVEFTGRGNEIDFKTKEG